jgi:DNA-binding GntR family transcriptional regulator
MANSKSKNYGKGGQESSPSDHTHKAYMGIRKMLFHNEIVPGQKISYRDLAERLSMSPTPVIQALKWLEIQGLVRHQPYRGYYTEPVSLKEVEEIYTFRELLEVSLLPETLKNLDKKAIKRLKNALEAHLTALRSVYLNERLIKGMEFHLILASLSGMGIQQQTLRHLYDLLYLKYRGNILFVSLMNSVDTEHKEIFDFVVSRNLQGSQEALSRHISNVKKHVIEGLALMIEEKESSEF